MESFNVDNPTVGLLLVSKRWNAIAKATPQLWSKIALIQGSNARHRLKGVHCCRSLEHLSSVLSFSGATPLNIEVCGGPQPKCVAERFSTLNKNLKAGSLDGDRDWFGDALTLLGADGRSRRWHILCITAWHGENSIPCEATSGPFDNLRLLSIHSFSGVPYSGLPIYEPLVAAIVRGATRISTVVTDDIFIVRRAHGWKDERFWRNMESYRSLPCTFFLRHPV